MIQTLFHLLFLMQKMFPHSSLSSSFVRLQPRKLQFQKDSMFTLSCYRSFKDVQNQSTMEPSTGRQVKCLHSAPFLKKVDQFDLQDKIHAVEHSQTATQSSSIKKMEVNGRRFVRSSLMQINFSLWTHCSANMQPWALNTDTPLSAMKHLSYGKVSSVTSQTEHRPSSMNSYLLHYKSGASVHQ